MSQSRLPIFHFSFFTFHSKGFWRQDLMILLSLLAFIVLSNGGTANAAQNPLVRATVVDVAGKPVKGAYIFFYDSADTKRAVDLVSPVTDSKGNCEKEVPPGRYWVLARLKSNASFDMGPLMIEDKFSGDPLEVEVVAGQELSLDFTVMDLLDTIKTKSKKREDLNKVTGKIVNEKGEALADVFAYANKHQSPLSVPDFFSAWTGPDGLFAIYLPTGKYNLGAATSLSTDQRYKADTEIMVENDLADLEIVLRGVRDSEGTVKSEK